MVVVAAINENPETDCTHPTSTRRRKPQIGLNGQTDTHYTHLRRVERDNCLRMESIGKVT